MKRILFSIKPKLPVLKHLSDSDYFRVLARLSKKPAPILDLASRQDAPLPRGSLKPEGVRR